jgi:pimeloyl-ACP methyl ester carboxylesterase
MRALLHAFDWRPFEAGAWEALPMPLLVLFGTRDRFVDGSELGLVRRERPDAVAEWVAGAGHILPEEVPEQLNPMLVALAGGGGERVAERSA